MPKTIWDIEGVLEEAKNLRLKEGYSFGRIADILTLKFGHRVTRNAVLGKFNRVGISGGPARPAHRKKMQPRSHPWGGKSAFLRPAKPKKPIEAILATAPIPEAQPQDKARVSFHELDPKVHCSFIPFDPQVGDALHSKKYCGLPIVHGSPAPYCLEHLRRCYPIPDLKPRTPSPYRPYVPISKVKEDA